MATTEIDDSARVLLDHAGSTIPYVNGKYRVEKGSPQVRLQNMVATSSDGTPPLQLSAVIIVPNGAQIAGDASSGPPSGGNPNSQTWSFTWNNQLNLGCDYAIRVTVGPPGTDFKEYGLSIVSTYNSNECL